MNDRANVRIARNGMLIRPYAPLIALFLSLSAPLTILVASEPGPPRGEPAPLIIGDGFREAPVHLEFITDPTGTRTVDAMTRASDWRAPPRANFKLRYSPGTHWLRFALRNTSDRDRRVYCVLGFPLLQEVSVHTLRGTQRKEPIVMGGKWPAYLRPVHAAKTTWRIDLAPGETVFVLLELRHLSDISIDLNAIDDDRYHAAHNLEVFPQGAYYGIMLVMLLYNLFLFVSTRDRNYLLYCIYVALFAVWSANVSGYGPLLLYPELTFMTARGNLLALNTMNLALLVFSGSFLNLPKRSRLFLKLYWIPGIVYAIMIPGIFLIPYRFALTIILVATLTAGILVIASSLVLLVRGYRPARFFLLAFLTLLMGGLSMALVTLRLVEGHPLLFHGVQIGSALEVLLLSFALGDRINLLRQKAQSMKDSFVTELEHRVESRTRELNTALGELQEREKQIQGELKLGRVVQSGILPATMADYGRLRTAVHYTTMGEVGGDFYDFVTDDSGATRFLLADVSGHGVPAALLTSMIKVAFHDAARDALGPAEILARLDHSFVKLVRASFYMTAVCGTIDPDGTLRYSVGGHPPPIQFVRESASIHTLPGRGKIIGLIEQDDKFEEERIRLAPGDRIAVFTDGMSETQGKDNEVFGRERIESIVRRTGTLPLPRSLQTITGELQTFARAGLQDDVTLMLLEWSAEEVAGIHR